ncbi:MAG: tRNA uridine-5-carboxymethylaminomethyl(34) synthesis GTPase MnmE [bacterium]
MEEIETIVAIITAHGKSAVNVIRLSGADAFSMAKQLGVDEKPEHHRIYVKKLKYNGRDLDTAVISFFCSPNSYTGEDVVEISVHGGRVSADRIVKILIGMGCRPAVRGEFTKRAFINNKMTLLEAESVLTRINAVSEETFDFASEKAVKAFEKEIERLKERLIELKSYIQSSIDFSDDVEYSPPKASEILFNVKIIADEMKKKSHRGLSGENHPLMVITGRTNTGKSTLFNSLLESERSIVSHEEGTTRDIISEWALLNGHYIKIMDTAGIRDAKSFAEKRGIEMLKERIANADIVLYLYDLSKGIDEEERREAMKIAKRVIICGNKSDIGYSSCDDIAVSALTGEGMNEMKERIISELLFNERSEISVNERQMNLIERISAEINDIFEKNETRESEILDERISILINDAKELTGEVGSEEILENIFSKFCIGK